MKMIIKTLHLLLLLILGIFVTHGLTSSSDAPAYVGSKACKSCHSDAYNSWKKTKLASALDSLKAGNALEVKKKMGIDPTKDFSADPQCVKCHTTGYGEKGGFVSLSKTPDLAGIGCEVCHGPGEHYVKLMREVYTDQKKSRYYSREKVVHSGLNTDFKQRCLQCHNQDSPVIGKDYIFNHNERYKHVHDKIKMQYRFIRGK